MATTIDALQLSITADAASAVSALEALNKSLKKLGSKPTSKGIANAVDNMRALNAEAQALSKVSPAMAEFSKNMAAIKRQNLGGTVKNATALGKGLNVASLNAFTLLGNFSSLYRIGTKLVDTIAPFIDEAANFEGIGERFMRGYQEYAEETYTWFQKLNAEMGLNVQDMMQYSSIYAQMLQGMGISNQKDVASISTGLTELGYDIWAAYNDVYGSYEDVANALKSGLAGQVRPLRQAGFDITEAALERTAANHNLEVSVSNLSQAEKTYLRYQTLVDQAQQQNIVGTYAKEMNTAEGVMRTLAQEVKSLGQAFGSIFLPALTKVIPAVTAVVQIVADAVQYLASLFGITIQAIDFGAKGLNAVTGFGDDAEEALSGAGGAAEKLKRTLLSLDEINKMDDPKSGGGGGGGGASSGLAGALAGLNVDSLWTDKIFENVSKQVSKIKDGIKEWADNLSIVDALLGVGTGAGIIFGVQKLASLGGDLVPLATVLKGLGTIAVTGVAEFGLSFMYASSAGNPLFAIGEALVSVAGGALAFKMLGTTGLALSMAVSVIAEVQGYTASIKKGNATTEDMDIKQELITMLQGAVGGGSVGFMVGGIPGLIIGAVLGATISDAYFRDELDKAKVQAGLEEKFGNWDIFSAQLEYEVSEMRIYLAEGGDATVVADKLNVEVRDILFQYGNDVSKVGEKMWDEIEGMFSSDDFDYKYVGSEINEMYTKVWKMLQDGSVVPPETVAQVQKIWEITKPTAEALQATQEENRKLGIAVPTNIRVGMMDNAQLGALAGDEASIAYLLGTGLSQSSEFLNALATIENAAEGIPLSARNGIIDNLDYVRDATTGMIVGIRDTTTGQVKAITPTMIQNLKDLGITSAKAFADPYVASEVVKSGTYIIDTFGGTLEYKGTTKKTIDDAAFSNVAGLYGSMKADIEATNWNSLYNPITSGVQTYFDRNPVTLKLTPRLTNSKITLRTYDDSIHMNISGYEGIFGPNAYATGGMPTSGEIFMARENGMPEYVGSFGNRSVVANNDQIVDGIAQGVSDANEAQNALLREQNRLLTAILNQGGMSGGGGVASSQDVIAALNQANRRAGRTIVNVGV